MAAPCFWRVSGCRIPNKRLIYLANVPLLLMEFSSWICALFNSRWIFVPFWNVGSGFLGFHELSFKQLPAVGNCGHCLWLNDKCFTFPNLKNSYGADFAGINFVDLFLQRLRQVACCWCKQSWKVSLKLHYLQKLWQEHSSDKKSDSHIQININNLSFATFALRNVCVMVFMFLLFWLEICVAIGRL